MIHVDFEIKSVFNNTLVVRFRIGDQHYDTTVVWDGVNASLRGLLRAHAMAAIAALNQPPPPTPAQLAAKIGATGHLEIDEPPGPQIQPPSPAQQLPLPPIPPPIPEGPG